MHVNPPSRSCHRRQQRATCTPSYVREGVRTVHEGLRGRQRRADDLRIQIGQAALGEVLHLVAVDAEEQAVDGEVAPALSGARKDYLRYLCHCMEQNSSRRVPAQLWRIVKPFRGRPGHEYVQGRHKAGQHLRMLGKWLCQGAHRMASSLGVPISMVGMRESA